MKQLMDQRAHFLAKLAYERALRDRSLTAAQKRHPKETIAAMQKKILDHASHADSEALVDSDKLRRFRTPSALNLAPIPYASSSAAIKAAPSNIIESEDGIDVIVDDLISESEIDQVDDIPIGSLLPEFAKDSQEDDAFLADLYAFESGEWKVLP